MFERNEADEEITNREEIKRLVSVDCAEYEAEYRESGIAYEDDDVVVFVDDSMAAYCNISDGLGIDISTLREVQQDLAQEYTDRSWNGAIPVVMLKKYV